MTGFLEQGVDWAHVLYPLLPVTPFNYNKGIKSLNPGQWRKEKGGCHQIRNFNKHLESGSGGAALPGKLHWGESWKSSDRGSPSARNGGCEWAMEWKLRSINLYMKWQIAKHTLDPSLYTQTFTTVRRGLFYRNSGKSGKSECSMLLPQW